MLPVEKPKPLPRWQRFTLREKGGPWMSVTQEMTWRKNHLQWNNNFWKDESLNRKELTHIVPDKQGGLKEVKTTRFLRTRLTISTLHPKYEAFLTGHNKFTEKWNQLLTPLSNNSTSLVCEWCISIDIGAFVDSLYQKRSIGNILLWKLSNSILPVSSKLLFDIYRRSLLTLKQRLCRSYIIRSEIDLDVFQWEYLSTDLTRYPVIRGAHISPAFIETHNKNVDKMRALLNEPVWSIASKIRKWSRHEWKSLVRYDELQTMTLRLKVDIIDKLTSLWDKAWLQLVHGIFFIDQPDSHDRDRYSFDHHYRCVPRINPLLQQLWDFKRRSKLLTRNPNEQDCTIEFHPSCEWRYNGIIPTNKSPFNIAAALLYAFKNNLDDLQQSMLLAPGESIEVEFNFNSQTACCKCKRWSSVIEETIEWGHLLPYYYIDEDIVNSQPNVTFVLVNKPYPSYVPVDFQEKIQLVVDQMKLNDFCPIDERIVWYSYLSWRNLSYEYIQNQTYTGKHFRPLKDKYESRWTLRSSWFEQELLPTKLRNQLYVAFKPVRLEGTIMQYTITPHVGSTITPFYFLSKGVYIRKKYLPWIETYSDRTKALEINSKKVLQTIDSTDCLTIQFRNAVRACLDNDESKISTILSNYPNSCFERYYKSDIVVDRFGMSLLEIIVLYFQNISVACMNVLIKSVPMQSLFDNPMTFMKLVLFPAMKNGYTDIVSVLLSNLPKYYIDESLANLLLICLEDNVINQRFWWEQEESKDDENTDDNTKGEEVTLEKERRRFSWTSPHSLKGLCLATQRSFRVKGLKSFPDCIVIDANRWWLFESATLCLFLYCYFASSCPKLVRVYNVSRIDEQSFEIFCSLLRSNRLKTFHMKDSESFTDIFVTKFVNSIREQSLAMNPLKSFYLCDASLSESSSKQLTDLFLKTCPQLTVLGLSGRKLTLCSDTVQNICSLIGSDNHRLVPLQVLDLSYTTISDESLLQLATAISKSQSLQTVNLLKMNIKSPQVIIALIDGLKLHPTIKKMGFPYGNFASVLETNTAVRSVIVSDDDYKIDYCRAILQNLSIKLQSIKGFSLNDSECLEILDLDSEMNHMSNKSILSYLATQRLHGTKSVKRVKVIVVGNGETGKTTMIRRLRDGTFDDKAGLMTDGVEISHLVIKDIEMVIYDFAGQPEYEHTHPLFFDSNAVYLLLHNPRSSNGSLMDRLKMFVEMIANATTNVNIDKSEGVVKAPIILVTTRAEEAMMSEEEMELVRSWTDQIQAQVAIDSKTGKGYDTLIQHMVDLSMSLKSTVKSIPTTFEILRHQLIKWGDIQGRFSMKYEEIRKWIIQQQENDDDDDRRYKIVMSEEYTKMALNMFISWGYLFRLSNGDIVLRPQRLANVLACVFTKVEATKRRIGDVQEGVLHHSDAVLDAIWKTVFPGLSSTLWRCTIDQPISPFLALLYQSKLAFQLYDPKGTPMPVSLVPALLSHHPPGYDSYQSRLPSDLKRTLSYTDIICKMFIPLALLPLHPTLILSFGMSSLPTAFFSRLQVLIQRLIILGGSWKKGCCVALRQQDDKEGSNNSNNTHLPIQSMCILYQASESSLHFYSAGIDTAARSAIINNMLDLLKTSYSFIKLPQLTIQYDHREYNHCDIEEHMIQGYIEHKRSGYKISVIPLRVFFPSIMHKHDVEMTENEKVGSLVNGMKSPRASPTKSDQSSSTTLLPSPKRTFSSRTVSKLFQSFAPLSLRNPDAEHEVMLKECPDKIKGKLIRLECSLEQAEQDMDANRDTDLIFLSNELHSCIPAFLYLLGLKKQKGLSTLWLICSEAKQSDK